MNLKDIYRPVRRELEGVEKILRASLGASEEKAVLEINRFLLTSPGKRLRPALLVLSALSVSRPSASQRRLMLEAASAIELIHMASLVHDDIIDRSFIRHHRPTVNSRWGADVSIAVGDYLHALAFEAVARGADRAMLAAMARAACAMCEGEIMQLCERENAGLSKEKYLRIVEKKTATLFAVACESGVCAVAGSPRLRRALARYGFYLGMAFQIVDDYRDLAVTSQHLGKAPGQDISVGEFTLPLLNLLESVDKKEAVLLRHALKGGAGLKKIRAKMRSLDIASRIRKVVASYLARARKEAAALPQTPYRRSLMALADSIGNF